MSRKSARNNTGGSVDPGQLSSAVTAAVAAATAGIAGTTQSTRNPLSTDIVDAGAQWKNTRTGQMWETSGLGVWTALNRSITKIRFTFVGVASSFPIANNLRILDSGGNQWAYENWLFVAMSNLSTGLTAGQPIAANTTYNPPTNGTGYVELEPASTLVNSYGGYLVNFRDGVTSTGISAVTVFWSDGTVQALSAGGNGQNANFTHTSTVKPTWPQVLQSRPLSAQTTSVAASAYTVLDTDYTVYLTATSTQTVTFPATPTANRIICLVNPTDVQKVCGAYTALSGALSVTAVPARASIVLQYDGTRWSCIEQSRVPTSRNIAANATHAANSGDEVVLCSATAPITFTIGADARGTTLLLVQQGTGTVTVAGSGVSVRGATLTLPATTDALLRITYSNTGLAHVEQVFPDPTPVVNDQAANGFMDIGNVRYQWGVSAAALGARTITFPAAFANANYAITATAGSAGSVAVAYASPTTTTVSLRAFDTTNSAASSNELRWVAIGRKP